MKKLLAITLLIAYGFSSMGMSVKLNFCCGELKSMDFLSPAKENCNMQSKISYGKCCETKELKSKTPGDYNFSSFSLKSFLPGLNYTLPSFYFSAMLPSCKVEGSAQVNSSPPLNTHPLFVMNCIFRI
jgi:hypothetical protein